MTTPRDPRTSGTEPTPAASRIAMVDEHLQVRYVPIDTLQLWDRNPKKHEPEQLATSIRRYGFKDPPKFEPSLNGGRGGIVEGNGRIAVLRSMEEAGEEPPRGIAVDSDGQWLVPVLFGLDARSQAEAESYGVDHNALTLGGSGLGVEDLIQLFDEEALQRVLGDIPDASELLVSLSTEDLDALLQGPDFKPAAAEDQSRLDEREPIVCPECGAEIPR